MISKSLLTRLFSYFLPYKKQLFFAFFALFLTAFTILLFGKVAKYFIDFALYDIKSLNYFFLFFVVLVLILAICGFLRSNLINSICFKVCADLRNKIYQNLSNLSPKFFSENKIGDIISRISNDVDVVFEVLSGNFAFFLRNLILFVAGLIFLFLTNLKLSLISISLIILAILPILIFAKRIKNLTTKSKEFSSLLISQTEETLSAIKTIQAFLTQKYEYEKFKEINNKFLRLNLQKTRIKSLLIALVIFLAFISIAIILFIGAKDVNSQKITSGELSAFIFYSVITSISLVGLGQISSQIQTLKSSCARIFYLLDIKSEIIEITNSVEISKNQINEIIFENVDFSYSDSKEKLILQKFNLEIKKGQKILIFGESGIGKTTIFNLLLRFYDIDFGNILINKINIKNIKLESLRRNFSYNLQENFIFSGTILQNIKYANQEISKKEIQEIVDSYKVFEFINNFKDGLETEIGEKGAKLSGGQRQRIAVLRALIKDSDIILLDEPTSNLDKENEDEIYDFINKFCASKTLIMISHKKPEKIKFDQEIIISHI